MLLRSEIEEVYHYQSEFLNQMDLGTERQIGREIDLSDTHIKILTGIRRSGKSTVLLQLARRFPLFNFFSFEDPRLSNFEVNDFFKLENIFDTHSGSDWFFFDEIQNVKGWEKYIRILHDKKKRVVVTGSNAKVLSKELGTSLTGRQISYEVFPFSFREFLLHMNLEVNETNFLKYLFQGGMPEFLNTGNPLVITNLYNDLIYRDIVVRHGLRNPKVVKEMGIYLASNTGKEFSYSNLAKNFELGSNNTAIAYMSYFEDAYLFFTVPRFSYSLKQQAKNPKKIYGVDTGVVANLSMSFTKDEGRLLENLVFMQLKRMGLDIYYYRQKGECDFVGVINREIQIIVQVCFHLSNDNYKREVTGLLEALNDLQLSEGFILTKNQKETFNQEGKEINVLPVWEWILQSDLSL